MQKPKYCGCHGLPFINPFKATQASINGMAQSGHKAKEKENKLKVYNEFSLCSIKRDKRNENE